MTETRIAKLINNGVSQVVCLPVEFRFDGDELYATRDDATGDVVLSRRPGAKTWNEFFGLLHEIDVPADFMTERPMNVLPREGGVFDLGGIQLKQRTSDVDESPGSPHRLEEVICPTCVGTGCFYDPEREQNEVCPACGGSGVVVEE